MEQFSVKLSGLKQRVSEEDKIIKGLSGAESELWSVRNSLSFQISSKANLQNVLKSLAQQVGECESDMRTMRSVLNNVHDQYEKTERRICGYVNDHPINTEDIWEAVTTIGKGVAISAINPAIGMGWLVNEILKDEEWETESKWGKYEHTLWDKLDKKKEDNKLKEHYEWEDGKFVKKEQDDDDSNSQKTDAQKRKEVLESITIWSGSVGKEGSLLHFGKDGDVETDWGKYSYSADVMKAEVSASGHVSMAGLGGEVGVALTAFTAGASGQLGSDMLGVHGKANLDVGKAEAKISGDFGLMDEDGKFNPQAGVSASAEAIAAEVSGEVGFDVAGADINVGGSLNFGIGAHADVGLQDGKLSLDIGASVGVGASVKLEVDVSGTVDMIVDHAADIGNAAVDAYNATVDFVGDAANAVGDFAGDVAEGVGNALSSAGDSLSKGWNTFKSWF